MPRQQVFIKTEEQDVFHKLYQALIEEHQPVGLTKTVLVGDMAFARFRLLRVHILEAGFFDMRLQQTASMARAQFGDRATDPMRLALAFHDYHTITFNALSRYEARLHREFLRSLNQLLVLQSARATQQKVEEQKWRNKPNPKTGHPPPSPPRPLRPLPPPRTPTPSSAHPDTVSGSPSLPVAAPPLRLRPSLSPRPRVSPSPGRPTRPLAPRPLRPLPRLPVPASPRPPTCVIIAQVVIWTTASRRGTCH